MIAATAVTAAAAATGPRIPAMLLFFLILLMTATSVADVPASEEKGALPDSLSLAINPSYSVSFPITVFLHECLYGLASQIKVAFDLVCTQPCYKCDFFRIETFDFL